MMIIHKSDIDIDLSDRDQALIGLKYTSASIISSNEIKKHNTGIYFHQTPIDPVTELCSVDYQDAEQSGFYKFDLLNVNLYKEVKDEDHLIRLMNTEPDWSKLFDREYCSKLIHIGNHYDTLRTIPEPVDSIEKMAMFISLIRPGKKHLANKNWDEISKTIWEKSDDFSFKKAHAISYSFLVVVNMNLLNGI